MRVLQLDGTWKVRVVKKDKDKVSLLEKNGYELPENFIEAEVPGSVLTTFFSKGKIPDPYYRDNEFMIQELMENSFEYELDFDGSDAMMNTDAKYLRFEGVDTLARVFLNEMPLGTMDNMHRTWEFDIDGVLRMGNNTLRVVISSATEYIRQAQEQCYTGGVSEAMEGYPQLRKSHCSFGWDWAPRIPDAGIFRSVSIVAVVDCIIEDVAVHQTHSPEKVVLDFDISIKNALHNRRRGESDWQYDVEVIDPDGRRTVPGPTGSVVIRNPKLWWPNGYGEQPLYTVKVTLTRMDGSILDEKVRRIGLRVMELERIQDQWGESFAHRVNGVSIFAMGAAYVPMDCMVGSINEERTRKLLKDCVAANYNTIRVWGGGYYPDDYFYDICDELGILVWQDLMFSCASYELTSDFKENIEAEITDTIRRIRHHACLALWCGNNELEQHVLEKVWNPSKKQVTDYVILFEHLIPELVHKLDPDGIYWASSPSSGGNFDEPNDENRGDAHYWDVWHGTRNCFSFREYYFRYLSEFGFQSFPNYNTILSFTEEEDRNVFSRVMEMHQRNANANAKIVKCLCDTYLYPLSLSDLVYASQLLQAETVRYGIEHYRRNRGRCMGTIVWQLNDIWPSASWSSIDYFGRWKALHYIEKRAFSPVLISCEEIGEVTQRPSCTLPVSEIEKSVRLNIANEKMEEITGTVRWSLRNADGSVVKQAEVKVKVSALTSVWFDKIDFSDCDELSNYFSYEMEIGGEVVSGGTVLFTSPKHFKFENPKLSYRMENGHIIVKAEKYAKNVMIEPEDGELLLSDNYFDMNPGERSIEILEGSAQKLVLKSVYDIGRA